MTEETPPPPESMHRTHNTFIRVALLASVFLAACESAEPPVATALTLSLPQMSFDALGATQAVAAIVRDQNGNEMTDVTVTWTSTSSSVTVPSSGMSVVVTSVANGNGSITATAGSATANLPFSVQQTPQTPTAVEGQSQAAVAGSTLPQAIRVKVADRLGNAMAGQTVTFSVAGGGGTATPSSAVTDAGGFASTNWRLGTNATSAQQLSVSVAGVPTTLTVNATATAGAPTTSAIQAGNNQTAAAGSAVAVAPAVRVADQFNNPVAGATVTFAIASGGGSLSGASATTNGSGIATLGAWTLGTAAGPKTLTASLGSLTPIVFNATAVAGPTAAISVQAGNNQSAPPSTPVAIAPRVKAADSFGNPVAGVAVTFAVTSGGGTISGANATTGSDGTAAVGGWTLGSEVGVNTLSATALGFATQFTATSFTPPARVAAYTSPGPTIAGTAVSRPPAVRVTDAYGGPAPGIPVTFAVTEGGGVITGASTTTDTAGIATVGSWTTGPIVGNNTLTATVRGLPPFAFTIAGLVGPPAIIEIVAGNNQSAIAGTNVPVVPSVRVSDVNRNPAPDIQMVWEVTRGGGSAVGTRGTTDSNGISALTTWTLGVVTGLNTITATAIGSGISGNPATFSATAPTNTTGYDIELRFSGAAPTVAQQSAFASAESRWESLITGDIASLQLYLPAGACGVSHGVVDQSVDDLIIFAVIEGIDGPGGTVVESGPCAVRTPNRMPVVGVMRFDAADLQQLESAGQLNAVVLHEMGHVLGIGTIWEDFGLLQNPSSTQTARETYFSGSNGLAAFEAVGGSRYTGAKVPVENRLGASIINRHWRESVLGNELMTGVLNSGSNPLSQLSVRSLSDLGYTVNAAAADPFTLTLTSAVRSGDPSVRPLDLGGDLFRGPRYQVDAFGRLTRVP
jgi:hypothetical protein